MHTYLWEWKLAKKLEREERHPPHPEEKDVVACFQQGVGEERFQVISLVKWWGGREEGEEEEGINKKLSDPEASHCNLLRPAQDGKGK